MINSTVTTKISAAFLATVLFAGIIALSHPSFMVGAQAAPEYGMDSYDKKSNGKDVSIKKVKCNNINVNVNGLTLNTTSVPFLSNLLASEAHADEDERGASSYGSGGSYGSDGSYGDKKSGSDKSFKFICINNNNNNVAGGNVTVPPTTPPTPTPVENECEECFDNLTVDLQVILNAALLEGFSIGELVVPAGSTLEELCELLDGVAPIEITLEDLIGFIFSERIFNEDDIFSLLGLLLCLQGLDLVDFDLGIILGGLIDRGLVSPDAAAPLQ
jgi:hypothetical protein